MNEKKTIRQNRFFKLATFCGQNVVVFVVFGLFQAAHAQGEWKWAHCWSGDNGTSPSDYYNYIFNTAFDNEGNLYVYGMMGGRATLDGSLLHFCDDSRVLLTNNKSILLSKFDTLGNMLWHKVVKQSSEPAIPNWMEVRDDKIHISGNCQFGGDSHYEWLFYLDTLIEEAQITVLPDSLQKPPYKRYSRWTFFATLDLDGNLLEDHFVETFSREYYEPVHLRLNESLCYYNSWYRGTSPFHVDHDGNWHVFTPIWYRGVESAPFTVVVYGATDQIYDLYLSGNIDSTAPSNTGFSNAMYYKFSPEWQLLQTKLLIDHVEGAHPYYANGSDSIVGFTTRYLGMSYDEEDNMYLSGEMELSYGYPNSGGLLNHYPVYYYWDSIHRLTVHDITSAANASFIIKYDTAGNVVWNNQLHVKGRILNHSTNVCSANASWHGNTFYNQHVYISGWGAYINIDEATTIYFDSEENPLLRYTEISTPTGHTGSTSIGFFVRYHGTTGTYVSQGIIPADSAEPARTPGVVNNRVFNSASYGYQTEKKGLFVEWQNDGQFVKADSVEGRIIYHSFGTVANERGYVATALFTEGNMHFRNMVETDCSNSDVNAVLALYYNPEFTEPYVGVPEHPQQLTVNVWPNPTVQSLQISCDETMMESVAVLDMTGRELHRQPVFANRCHIDVSPLPAGMYLLKIRSNGKTQNEKFIKSAY